MVEPVHAGPGRFRTKAPEASDEDKYFDGMCMYSNTYPNMYPNMYSKHAQVPRATSLRLEQRRNPRRNPSLMRKWKPL